ncbi:MAG: serine hydrolase [Proteobacteria bacterium]|nr:serine hydrolase [Pseudomonadota bacterium]
MSRLDIGRRQFALGATVALGIAATSRASANSSRRGLDAFRQRARALGARAVIVMRGRETLVSEGPVAEVQRIASCRKSIVNALYGMAVAAGRIDLNATLADVGVNDNPPLTDAERQATIRDLLEARSGVYIPASAETPRMASLRPLRGSHPHGAFWYYNNWDFNVLGEIYQRVTGEGLFTAIEHRLAIPLGWRDFHPLEHMQWGYEPASPRFGAYNMWMSTRDMARFGQLFLNGGRWNGAQLVPESWIADSTRVYSTTDHDGILGGYGYLWWITTDQGGKNTYGLPLGSYTAAGNGGRYISIFPGQNLLVAVQPEEHDGQPQAQIYTDLPSYNQLLRQLLDAVG